MWIWPVKNFAILALHTTSLSGLIQILYFLICSYILIKEKIHDDFIIADDNIIDKLYYLKICVLLFKDCDMHLCHYYPYYSCPVFF